MVKTFKSRMAALYFQLQAAQIERRISNTLENAPIPLRQLLPLASLTPIEQPAAQWALDRMTDAEVDHVLAFWRRAIRSPSLDPDAGPEADAVIRFIELAEERYAQL